MNPEFKARSIPAPGRIVLVSPASRLPSAPVTPALRGPESKLSGQNGALSFRECREERTKPGRLGIGRTSVGRLMENSRPLNTQSNWASTLLCIEFISARLIRNPKAFAVLGLVCAMGSA
jgi:hypothetical protein